MREILFRAKAINRIEGKEYRTNYKNGDWVYGLLSKPHYKFGNYDFTAEMTNTDLVSGIDVDYTTLGQFTGLTDCNGNKIFEGDIVACYYGGKEYKGKIIYFDCAFCVSYSAPVKFIGTLDDIAIDCEIIGNIHDNPGLLGGDTHD